MVRHPLVSILLVLLTGCGDGAGMTEPPPAAGPETTATPARTAPASATTTSTGPGVPSETTVPPVTDPSPGTPGPRATENPVIDPALAPLVEKALADLAVRIGDAPVTVVSAERVTWPDTSYGCPRPGMVYAPVVADGSRIVLEASGRRYDYHVRPDATVFLCG